MALFSYQGRDKKGVAVNGNMQAHSREVAVTELMQKGIVPIRIQEIKQKQQSDSKSLLTNDRVSQEEIILFSRQLYALTKAGIPIIRALKGLAESNNNVKLKSVLEDISQKLIEGLDLASSLKAHPKLFSSVYVSMIHVGESTGNLDQALYRLIDHLEVEKTTKKRISQAMRYPSIVVAAIVIATSVIMIFVVPNFSTVFEKLGTDLPLATKILMASSNFMIEWWGAILTLLTTLTLFINQYRKTERGALDWDRFKLKIPLIGSIYERVALARFSRSFAMMLAAGVPILSSLKIISGTLGNLYIGNAITSMGDGIERGEGVTNTASATGLFTPLVLQMLSVGEETGAIDTLLNEVADFYEQEVDHELKQLSDAIEPILLLFLGALIILLALGVFLPVWELSGAMNK